MRTRGATAVELSLVVVIVAILCGTAAPRVTTALSTARVRSAEKTIAGALRYTRQMSMARNETMKLRLETDVISLTDGLGHSVRRFPLPSGLTVESEPTVVVYSSRGTCTPARILVNVGTVGVEIRMNLVGFVETMDTGTGCSGEDKG